MQPPVMPEDGHTTRVTSVEDISSGGVKDSSVLEALWDDEDTRAFYECLPDLRFFPHGNSYIKKLVIWFQVVLFLTCPT